MEEQLEEGEDGKGAAEDGRGYGHQQQQQQQQRQPVEMWKK